MDWVRENKPTVTVLGAGAFLALAGWFLGVEGRFGAASEAGEQLQARVRRLDELRSLGIPGASTLEDARARLQRETAAFEDLRGSVELGWPEGFEPPQEGDPVAHFNRILSAEQERFRSRIQWRGSGRGGDLGFDDNPREEDVALEWLNRLAVVSTLLQAMVDADLERVRSIDPFEGLVYTTDVSGAGASGIIAYRVFIEIEGPSRDVFQFLHSIQNPEGGRFLAILSLDARQSRSGADELTLKLSAAGLRFAAPEEEAP